MNRQEIGMYFMINHQSKADCKIQQLKYLANLIKHLKHSSQHKEFIGFSKCWLGVKNAYRFDNAK